MKDFTKNEGGGSDILYRDGLPPIPARLRSLPIERGYPVPWFVALVDGHYDFRVVDARKYKPAVERRLCWICGQRLGTYLVFPIGPMCAVNRTSGEPPSHRECAEWSAKACPFLTQREPERRETNMPEGVVSPSGCMIRRQPGVVLLWVTKGYSLFGDGRGGTLFRMGEPLETVWLREGRPATREEIMASVESGYPLLLEVAESEGPAAVRALEAQLKRALKLVPA